MSNTATIEKPDTLSLQSEVEFEKSQGISQSQYATRRGVSRQAISKHVKNGVITLLSNGKIDPEAADIEMDEKLDPAFRPQSKGEQQFAPTGTGDRSSTFHDIKTRKEKVNVELLELDLLERRGNLVSRRKIENAEITRVQAFRNSMLRVANRADAKVAVESDQFKCHEIIKKEIEKALVNFSSCLEEV